MESTASSRSSSGRPNDYAVDRPPAAASPSGSGDLFSDPAQSRDAASSGGAPDKLVCPYCGYVGQRPDATGPCPRCSIEDSPQTRQATKARIGPWYVLQARNPAAPGMKWSTLMALVKKGQVTPRSVVRGPTTHQLWRLASQVKGLSREFGVCYSCGLDVVRNANQCPHCDRLQEPPANPDALLESRDAPSPPRRAAAPTQFEIADAQAQAARTPPGSAITTRTDPRAENGLLTARELAAAFQLDLPEGSAAAATRTPPGSAVATASPSPPPTANRPRRRGRRVALVLLFLTLVGLGSLVWFTPEYRATAERYWQTGRDWALARWQAWTGSGATAPQDATAAARPQAPAPNRAEPADGQRFRDPAAQAAQRGGEAQPRVESRDDAPGPAGAGVTTSPPVVVDSQTLIEQARSLRRSAIDAEAAGDYARAARLYEQITTLPREYWPGDLQVRLDAARQRVK